MATITKESIAEAAKLSNMSVNDYIDKLPDNYLQEAAKLSNIDIATYKTKLKEVWGEGLKKKDDTSNVGSGSGALESGKSQSTSQSPKSSKPIIGTIQAQSNESPYIKVGINKPSVSTSKETKIVENEKKPIIGTKEAQQHKSIVSVDIPIKPLPTEEERDKALDKAKAEIELVKITNNFGNKKEDGTDDIAKNVTDYYDTSIRQTAVNDLSKPDQLILQLSESVKAIKNEQELIGQQYNSGKISENTYNTLNKNLEKNRTELELKTTGLISERNRDIDNEIKALKQVLLKGERPFDMGKDIDWKKDGGFTEFQNNPNTSPKKLSEDEKAGIKKQITILEKQKGNISENLKMQDEEVNNLQGALQESQKQGLIPKGATFEQALKIQYAKNDQTLKMLKEQSAKEGNPFVSSTSGMWDNAKEFVGDMLGHETLSKYNPETKQMEYQKFKSGYENTPRQYLINDKTANKIYELQEQQKALSSIIELDRYGNYKKDSGLANFTKQFIQSLAPTQKGKILTQSEIASATQQALNNAGIHEIQDVTGKVLNDNKHNISDMLGTTASFMVQFSLTPNVIGKVLSLGKLGMRYNAIRKVAENIEKGIKFTEKSRLGRLFGKMVETGVEYKGKGLLNAQLEEEADFGSGAFGVLGEKLLTKMFPFGAGRWASVIGRGWGELGEETGQQIWQTYKNNGYHIDETIQGLKQQFPEMKDVQMFVFGTALMGMGFGLGSKSTGNEKKISQSFGEWREKQIKKLLDEGKITQGELNKVNGIINDLTAEHTNAINQELKDGVSITEEEKSELIKNSKNVTEVKGKDGKITTTIKNENGEQIAIKDNKLYILYEETTSEYTANADGSVMHGARVIDNPNGLTEIELIKQDIESRKQQELIKADENGADKNEIEQRYNNELDNLEKNSIGSVQEQASTQTDSNSNKRDLQEQVSTTPKDTQEITYSYNGETYIEDNKGNLTKEDHSLVPIDQQQEIKNNGQKIINVKAPEITAEIESTADADIPDFSHIQQNSNIEAKKADIEKRRQEELNEYKDKDVSKVEEFTFTDEEGNVTYVQVRHYPNGKRVAYQGIEKNKYGNVNDNSPFEISKEQSTEDYLKVAYPENSFGKYSKTGERTGEEASLNAYSRKINANSDAEYIDKVKKGEFTKQQAKDALKEINRLTPELEKQIDDAELAALEETSGVSGSALKDVEEDSEKWYKAKKTIKDKDGNDIKLTIDKNKDDKHFYIKATDSNGKEVGSALFETSDGEVWSGNEIEVNEANRRKGIMSAMYDFAESEGHPLEPTKTLSKEGKAFWDNRKAPTQYTEAVGGSTLKDKKADIEKRRQEELDSVSKVINQDDKKILEDNINKRFDLELQKINKENETTSTQPTDTGKKQNDGKGVQESQPNNNGVGTGNVQPTQTKTEQQRERKVIQADIKAVNNAIAELEGKKGVIAKANLEKQKAKLAELNKELADTEESNTTKNTTTTHPTKSSTKKETPKNNLQHSLDFDNLDGKLAQDEAEHRHAESKLTIEDNIEQEPNVKIVESQAESDRETELDTAKQGATKLIDNATGVQRKPLSEIHTDEKRFQGRDKLNEQVVNDIAENFSDADQDPVHVWTDPKDGKTYVLSGHHRYYGAKKAGRTDIKIQDRTGDFTEAQAIKFATEEANANRSMETPLERAKTLRKKREKGDSKEDIQKFLDKEGKNKNYVENLSHLNPNGKAIASLNALENSGDKVTQKETEKIADWIGEARKQNKKLTDQHENELFDFLMNKNSSKRITTKAELISKIASITGTLDFDPSKPLNIERYKYKSEGEKQYDKEVEERKDKISELQQKINDINDRFKNPNNPNYVSTDHKDYDSIKAQADKVIADTNVQLKAEQKALQELYQQKGKYTNAGSNQGNLFEPKKEVYETKIETKDGKMETVQFTSTNNNNDYTSTDNIQQQDDKVKSSGIGRTITGIWNKFKNIQFTGTTKVKNASDVAHIMRLLEDKSVEHAFAVHIDSKGNSHIQFLSIGGISGTVVDSRLVLSGVTKFKSKKVYLVHNHPSGNMTPSTQDKKLTLQIAQGLKTLNVDLEHIIMDTYKQEYLVLNNSGEVNGTYKRNERNSGENLTTHIFDGVKVLSEPLMDIKSSQNVAEFLYQKRFSVLPKNGFIILNNKNQIIGNYAFKNNLDIEEILLNIGETPTATSIILYSNAPAPTNLKEVSLQLKKLDIGLLDYVEVKGGGDDIKGAYDYVSATDNGLIYELQEKYGTNNLGNTKFQQSTDNNTETTPEQKKEAKSIIKFLSDKFKGLFVDGQKAFDEKLKSLGIDESFLKFMADYRGLHKAPQKEGANSLDDMSDIFPSDLYSPKGFYYYADSHTSKADKESYKVIVEAKGKPNKKVKIYRAVPKGVTEINSGDWVTLSKEYAKMHGEHSLNGKYDIIETEVEAGKLFNEGSYNEFGVQFLKDKDGTVFGLYDPTENKIYLNERNLNPKTVWHEATHFQQAILKAMAQNGNKEAKKILTQFDKLLKPFVEQLLLGRTTVTIDGQRIPLQADVYKKGAKETTKAYKERMQDELWAFLQQEENHKLWQKNDTPFKRAVNKFKEAVTNLFKSILDIPKHKDISNMTLSELVGHTAKQLQDGRLEDSRNGEKGEVRMMTMPDGTKRQVKVLPEVTNGFYSPIEKKLLDEKATNLSATKWLERLGKGDEMQFTGLKEFLESKKPNEQVKKSELQAFMKDNRIEVVEVVKGGDASEAEIDTFLEDEMGQDMTREEAREYLSNDETNEQTKYHNYQLDGEKENYKEVLVMMPNKHIEDAKRVSKWLMGKEWKQLNNAERIQLWDKINEINNFKSSHFDEPNILVHLRMNSRTDAEGNKVLFLEEVQSDWGQTGKKDGFKTSENVWDTQLGKDAVAAIKDMDNLGFDSWQQAATAISKSKDPLNDFDINYEHKDLILKWRDAVNQERKTSIAPFVTDTNAWTKLGLKVALKEAVAQGADKIAWTTGEQQNDRYDLSKQVDDVWVSQKDEWWSQQDRNYIKGKDVEITLKGGGVNKFSVNENGEIVSGDFKGQKLEAVIGKEMAEKILSATEETNFGEQDLRVGGSGMKGFYGSPTESKLGIVGNVAKKLFGQEPKTIDVFQSDKLASGWSVTTKDINGNVQTNMFDSKSKGLAWLSKQEELEVLSEDAEGKNYTTQHSITITPEMRETVQEGQPLFMADTKGTQYKNNTDLIPITEAESKTLIDRLNKAFGGKVRLFSDWSRFIEQNKAVRFSVNKNYIGEALYIINKNAKKLRDLKRDLYNFQKYGDVTSGLAERAGVSEFNFSEEKNSLVVYEENGKAYYDIKDIEDAIKNQEREVSFIEDNDNYDEDELDFEKSYLNNLESIKETFENNIEKIKGVYMSDLSDELNRLYEFKGKVISKIGGKAIGVHVFPKGDVRELYKIGDFVFHGEDVSDDYTKEEILKLDKLGEISSDIKIDNIKSLEDAISEIEKKLGIQFMQLPDGTIYGAVLPDGSMYLNPENLNANTPIHEHTHLFNQVIQQTNPKLWNRMVEAVKGIGLWNEVKNDPNYKNLKTDSQIADEVYSRLTGNKGEVNWQERIAKADSKSRLAKVGELIKEYWNNVMDILGIKKMSADDFANMTLDKLFSGKEIKGAKEVLNANKRQGLSELQYSMLGKSDFDKDGNVKPEVLEEIRKEREKIVSEAKANGTYMKAPNGEKTKLNDEQWVMVRTERFKNWFGDWENDPKNASKVVDDNGEPLVVYHGGNSTEKITSFKKGKFSEAIFFSKSKDVAESYRKEYLHKTIKEISFSKEEMEFYPHLKNEVVKNPNKVFATFLSIKNPKILNYKGKSWLDSPVEREFEYDKNDGLIANNIIDGGNLVSDDFIAFEPNQIKSATDNVGTFSNESNDIRFSISNDGGQNLSDAEREEIRADLKMGLKLGNTIDELREMYAGTDEINISENDFSDLMSEAQKEFETEKSGKATKIDDDTEKDNDIQDTPKENKKDNRKKTYEWHRVHEGKFPKELIENLEKYDLDHEVENQELAEKRALAIIDNFGIENALKAVEKGYITGAEKAVVFSKAVEAIQAEIQLEIDPEIREKLAEDLGDIIRKTGDEMRDAGRFSAMWARIYKNSPLGYNAEYYINKYKESNNGEISKEMEDKFRELEETIKEQNAKIIELEKKQEEEIDKQIVESIVNNPPNKKDSKDKKSIKEKTKQLADKFRKFKTKPFTLKDADGNDIIIKQNSIVNYNDIIEAGAKIIEEAGRLGESIEMAIRKAREYVVSELEKQDWYKKLSQRDKDAVNTQLLEHFSIENTIESEYKISKGLLYELTKAGIERKGKDNYTIDDLVDDVYDIYKEQYPDLEKRQIRDDISNYGKTIDLSEEEIDVKLRNLRRDGKMLSAYEDLLNGNLPKRSGLQRDELTPSQREMQKKINDELRKIPKSAEQLKNAWKSALDAIKRKYQNQIEDLEKQIAKRERIVKILNRTELDDKANNLKARVEELKAELDELVGKKEMSEESKLRLVESNLKKSIEKTQDKIDYINKNGVEPKTPKNKSVTSNKIEALKEELKLKKEQLKLISEEIGLVEKKRLEMAKKRVAKQIEDLKERIANGDFSKKKRKPLPYDNELNDAKREKLKAQKEFELALYQNELANRGKFEIAKDALFEALNIPKGMLATLDMSAPLRQGSMLMFSNPIIFAKSFLKMHGFAFNSSKFENAQLDIENHKDYVLMHESGLGLTSPDARLMAREELFMQRLPKMIPIFSQLHSGSERAYIGFLNKLRVNVFLSGVEKLKEAGLSFESNSKAFKDLAKYVNYATGRGDTTTSEGLNKVLNTVFFSPKMITSRIQMFMLAINPNTTPQVRTMAIKSLLSFATYIASVGALSMAVVGKTMLGSDDDDENFKNFINPIHTNFAKIRKGDYVYDVTAGYAPLIRTIARMGVMAKISASGKKTELNGKGFRGETGISELGNFFENKLSPLARVVYSMPFLTNKNPNSNKFKETWIDTPPDELIKDIAKSLFIPISVGDIYQNLTDEEIKWYQATTNIILGMYGVGINKYSNKPTPSKQNKMGGGNGFGGK